jgi:hypothetical protein
MVRRRVTGIGEDKVAGRRKAHDQTGGKTGSLGRRGVDLIRRGSLFGELSVSISERSAPTSMDTLIAAGRKSLTRNVANHNQRVARGIRVLAGQRKNLVEVTAYLLSRVVCGTEGLVFTESGKEDRTKSRSCYRYCVGSCKEIRQADRRRPSCAS